MVQNEGVIKADRRPGVWARMLGSMLTKVRETLGLSYDQAAAQAGRDAEWLIRVETGFEVPGPDEVARLLVRYRVREARAADHIIDVARRASSPPPWLAPHVPRLSADSRDAYLAEAEATVAQVNGARLIPELARTEDYFRERIAPWLSKTGGDPDAEWDLTRNRQDHRPAGVTRLLDIILDESVFLHGPRTPALAGQVRHLLDLDDAPHATVRIAPFGAPPWPQRLGAFEVLSFAGTTDRIGIDYLFNGPVLAEGSAAHAEWTRIATEAAADQTTSRAILHRHLADIEAGRPARWP